MLHMIWTRSLDGQNMVGRLKVAQAVRSALEAGFAPVSHGHLRSILDTKSLSAAVRVVGEALRHALRGRPLPLQCLLFGDPAEARRILAEIGPEIRAVYLDGVRCLVLIERLRQSRPDIAIITDLDDLMSRRMRLLLALDQPPSTGYMKGAMPRVVERILRSRRLSKLVLRYEAFALARAERRIVTLSDAVVMVSGEDARLLAPSVGGLVIGVPPPARAVRPPSPLGGPLRFVFVGTDALRQNQLTIDAMISLWQREAIATPLAIYGEQTRSVALPANVTMPGYAASLDEIYDGSSILLSPSYLAGGLKTKVIEAFGYGTPVIGNRVTFEGMEIGDDYPLLIEEEAELLPLLQDPMANQSQIAAAATAGWALVRDRHDPLVFAERWREIVAAALAARATSDAIA